MATEHTAHINESAIDYPPFRRWWNIHKHEFPDYLKSVIATGFVAGHQSQMSLGEICEESKTEAINVLNGAFDDVLARLKKNDQ